MNNPTILALTGGLLLTLITIFFSVGIFYSRSTNKSYDDRLLSAKQLRKRAVEPLNDDDEIEMIRQEFDKATKDGRTYVHIRNISYARPRFMEERGYDLTDMPSAEKVRISW